MKINQILHVEGKTYRVTGIDTYQLTNIYEKTKAWFSYTLVDTADENKRIWLGYGFAKNNFIKQWIIPEAEFKKQTAKLPLNGEYTGIANITFAGNQGYSLPNSEVIWYNCALEKYDFFVIERFLEKKGKNFKALKSYYHGMKILKNTAIFFDK